MAPGKHDTQDQARDKSPSAASAEGLSDAPTAGNDAEMTWNPAQHDAFDDTTFFDDTNSTPPPPNSVTPPPRRATDPEATVVPHNADGITDVWGTEFDHTSPGQTIRVDRKTHKATVVPSMTTPRGTPPAKELAGYALERVLGEGGVGVVYQAIQESIDRQIAIKMIKSDVAADDREVAKFVAEAMVTGELDHPNIVPIHDLGQTADGQPFYAMKLVRGTPWSESIRGKALQENLQILLAVCDAVGFAHSKGVIHRDLKPENVMLGEFGEVQLMDWGLGAAVTDDSKAPRLTSSAAAGGTPAYMAPEMVTGEDEPVGYHSDIYLLGAILYEIIAHRPPHPGQRVLDTLENAMNNVIVPLEDGGVLGDIALKAMATKPADRYATARAFKDALLEYQAHAESIALADRARLKLVRAQERLDYEDFSEALYGFRQALQMWSENQDARHGLVATHLAYARCALDKGDLDLAASLLDASEPVQRELASEVARAQQRRETARRRLRAFRWAAIGLTAAVVIILTVSSIWIASAKRQAEKAKDAAVAAQQAESEQRRLAEAARTKAEAEEARAVKALADLEQAVQAMVAAQTKEEQARAQATAAEMVAQKTRDKLARTGMLTDNSWWVFDEQAARQRQQGAAESIDRPVTLMITLGNDVPLELILVPPGEFVMGSPPREEHRTADEHLHRVRLTQPYYLGRYELTCAQWQAVTGEPVDEKTSASYPALPATGMSVERIEQEFLPALADYAPDGWRFRLPTEAEWEFACRAGAPTAYANGESQDMLDATGWFLFNSDRTVQPGGQKQPNAFGLYDMHGNVGEICADTYDPTYYLQSPAEDPRCTVDVEDHVVRGGSILNTPEHCRCAYRSYVYRRNAYEFIGLRLALVPLDDAAGVTARTD